MKRIGIFCFSLLIIASCSADQEQTSEGPDIRGDIIDLRIKVALVDQNLQDRLNPESPAHFGDEYTQGIKILYLYNGAKRIAFSDDYTTIQPPFLNIPGYDEAVGQNSHGYYFLNASPRNIPEDGLSHIYIQYPDGSEDEVKVQVYENEEGTVVLIDEIRYNDELVYDMRVWDENPCPNYYNPKYYPVLEPVLDDKGNPIGEHVQPLHGRELIVVVK